MTSSFSRASGFKDVQRDSCDLGEQLADAALVSLVSLCCNRILFLRRGYRGCARPEPFLLRDSGSRRQINKRLLRGWRSLPEMHRIIAGEQGLSTARQAGPHYSEREYLVFLDANERLPSELLEVSVKQLSDHREYSLVFGHIQPIV